MHSFAAAKPVQKKGKKGSAKAKTAAKQERAEAVVPCWQ